jgi:hypothetical protein
MAGQKRRVKVALVSERQAGNMWPKATRKISKKKWERPNEAGKYVARDKKVEKNMARNNRGKQYVARDQKTR